MDATEIAGLESELVGFLGEFDDCFGRSVSLSDDHIIIGSWADDDAGLASGSAYLFSLDTDCTGRPARR